MPNVLVSFNNIGLILEDYIVFYLKFFSEGFKRSSAF